MKLISDEVFDEYQELKEKNTPKRVKPQKYKPLVKTGWEYACPACGCAVGANIYDTEYTDEYPYCDNCGQALDYWKK